MKFFGEKSVSSLVYNLLYGFLVFILTIMILVALILIPIGIVMLFKKPELFKNFIEMIVNFSFKDLIKLIISIGMLIYGGLQIGSLKITINLFNNFRQNIIFDIENVKFIKMLAYMKLLSMIIPLSMGSINSITKVINISKVENKIYFTYLESGLLVIVLFMIAIALEEAIKFKEENELTV